ncbi:conjugal transfer protein TraD [Acidithiobacillus thiooxidans]|uniref:conjugal transfer protein TraD n=1 Tax=Acidithiobacillus thiooxidans TaxID=930 RepID=UPI003D156A1B
MARKARNHALFKVGGLVELAGLLESDKGALLGGLLETAETWRDGPESPRF